MSDQRVAQFGSARASGARGRRFESFHADLSGTAGPTNAQVAERQLRQPVELLAHGLRGFESLPAHCGENQNAPEVLQWRNPRLQTERWQVRSLHGVLDRRLTTRPSGEAGSCNLPGSWFDSSRRLCDRSSIGRAPGCDPGRCGFESHRSPWRNWRPLKRTLHHFDHRFHDAGFRFQIRIKLPRQPRQVGAMGDPGRGVDLPSFDQLDDPREIAR